MTETCRTSHSFVRLAWGWLVGGSGTSAALGGETETHGKESLRHLWPRPLKTILLPCLPGQKGTRLLLRGKSATRSHPQPASLTSSLFPPTFLSRLCRIHFLRTLYVRNVYKNVWAWDTALFPLFLQLL